MILNRPVSIDYAKILGCIKVQLFQSSTSWFCYLCRPVYGCTLTRGILLSKILMEVNFWKDFFVNISTVRTIEANMCESY